MNRVLLLAGIVLLTGILRAQDGSKSLDERINEKRLKAMAAMSNTDPKAKADPSLQSSLAERTFSGSSFGTKEFGTSDFLGAKTAATKTYETRSFLGIKNPWFGKKVFETQKVNLGRESAREAKEAYDTDAYAVRKFVESNESDSRVSRQVVPDNTKPRPYLGPEQPSKEKGIDQFTQNLNRELTMEEVRSLLNKDQKAR